MLHFCIAFCYTLGLQNTDVVQQLEELNVRQILLSFHGDKIKHEMLTNTKGSYNKTINAIKLITMSHIKLTVEITVTKANINTIINIVQSLIKMNVKSISIMRYVDTGRNDDIHSIDYAQFMNIVDSCIELKKYHEVNIQFTCSQRLCLDDEIKPFTKSNILIENRKQVLL